MTVTDVLLVVLTVAVLSAGLSIAAAVKQAGGHLRTGIDLHREQVGADAAFIKGVVVEASAAAKGLNREIPAALTRLGVAADKIADDTPAQKSARHYQDMSEGLLLGIHAVLEQNVEHPEGLKDDVVVGREQGVALVKDRLQAELNKALN